MIRTKYILVEQNNLALKSISHAQNLPMENFQVNCFWGKWCFYKQMILGEINNIVNNGSRRFFRSCQGSWFLWRHQLNEGQVFLMKYFVETNPKSATFRRVNFSLSKVLLKSVYYRKYEDIVVCSCSCFSHLVRGARTMSMPTSVVLVGHRWNLFYSKSLHHSSAVPWVHRNHRNIVRVLPNDKRHRVHWTRIRRFVQLDVLSVTNQRLTNQSRVFTWEWFATFGTVFSSNTLFPFIFDNQWDFIKAFNVPISNTSITWPRNDPFAIFWPIHRCYPILMPSQWYLIGANGSILHNRIIFFWSDYEPDKPNSLASWSLIFQIMTRLSYPPETMSCEAEKILIELTAPWWAITNWSVMVPFERYSPVDTSVILKK